MSTRAFTPANQITALRLVFVPLFAIFEVSGRYGWALVVLVAAAVTDAVDGLVARLFRQETPLGVALDPIADKLLMGTAYIVLALRDALPWWLTILVLSRDVAIIVTALLISLVAGYRPFRPTTLGKVSTVLQVATLFAAVGYQLHMSFISGVIVSLCVYATAALTLASGIHYLIVVQHRYAHHGGETTTSSEITGTKNHSMR
jgi:cardiolipin synthase